MHAWAIKKEGQILLDTIRKSEERAIQDFLERSEEPMSWNMLSFWDISVIPVDVEERKGEPKWAAKRDSK